ncbi:MAG: response regulator [Chitinivibrionales bacterium]|nr:response regulator [Chitinivibrionales bacterium]
MSSENGCCARILVVDDNVTTASFIHDILEEAGFDACVCHSGRDALQKVQQQRADLVVLDVMLPDMDGLDVARGLKEAAGGQEFMPIIMLSALCSEEDKLRGLAHADDYVTKPFSRVELLARIKAFLRIQLMHRELSQSQRLYQALHDHAPFMYLSLDTELRITCCNIAFERATAMEREQIVGRQFVEFFDADERLPLTSFLTDVSHREGEQREAHFALVPPDGNAGAVHVGLRALHIGENWQTPCIVVVMQDMSRRLRLEQEQKMARMQLYRSARLTSLGMLASGVAHELNNPLTAILGFSSALLDRVRDQEEIGRDELQEYLSVINAETLRCRDVIEALSGFALDRESHIVDVSLLGSIDAAVRLLHPRARKHNLSIENRIEEDVYVRADGSRLGQAIVSIIANAIDFCGGGGRLIIEADQQPPDNPQFVVVRMTDDGPGIAPEVLPRVFDPFFTTKEVGRGTGLGLTICHSILKECGGSIDIFGEPGQGTTVVLEIPKAAAQG